MLMGSLDGMGQSPADSTEVLVQRAAALAEDGELHAAERLFLQAVTAYDACTEAASVPGLARACEMCAQVQLELGKAQDALRHAQRAAALQREVRLSYAYFTWRPQPPAMLATEVSAWAHARMAPRRVPVAAVKVQRNTSPPACVRAISTARMIGRVPAPRCAVVRRVSDPGALLP